MHNTQAALQEWSDHWCDSLVTSTGTRSNEEACLQLCGRASLISYSCMVPILLAFPAGPARLAHLPLPISGCAAVVAWTSPAQTFTVLPAICVCAVATALNARLPPAERRQPHFLLSGLRLAERARSVQGRQATVCVLTLSLALLW